MLVRTIADVIDCSFNRIQFTPDLMPADITGTNILIEEGGQRVFRFQPGPIFANLVLADEINRATPKTQSSLLEAMQEHQVTVARQRFPLERAVLRARDPEPARDGGHLSRCPRPSSTASCSRSWSRSRPRRTSIAIMDRTTGAESVTAGKVCTRRRDRRDAAPRPRRPDRAARDRLRGERPARRRTRTSRARPELVREYVRYGGSPRGAQALVTAGKIYALLDGRFNVSIDDIRAVALPSLRHRIILNFEGEAEGITTEAVVRSDPRRGRRRRPSSSGRHRTRDQAMTGPHDRAARRRRAPARPAGDRARRSCRARSTRPSSTRPSCASSSACCCSCGRRSGAASRAAGGASSAASRSSSPTTATTRSATTCASSTGTSTRGSRSCSSSCSSRRRTSPSRSSSTRSASMAAGDPAKLLFAKRAAAALGYIGLASEDRVAVTRARRPGRAGAGPRCAAPAASSGCWPTCRRSSRPTARPTCVAAARHAAAQLHGRGVVILLSDLLDPAADRVIRELAATGSELIVLHVLSPDELDPPLEGDLRLVDVETGDGVDVTVDLATLDAYKARLAAWKAGFADLAAKRRASYVDLAIGRATSPT